MSITAFSILANRNGQGFNTNNSTVAKIIETHEKNGLEQVINALISPDQALACCANIKGAMRLIQACAYIASQGAHDASREDIYAMLIAICALARPGDRITYATLQSYLGVRIEGRDIGIIAGVNRQKLVSFIDCTGFSSGTYSSKTSASLGKNGFLIGLGIASKCDAHGITVSADAHKSPFLTSYAKCLERLSEAKIEEIKQARADKKAQALLKAKR